MQGNTILLLSHNFICFKSPSLSLSFFLSCYLFFLLLLVICAINTSLDVSVHDLLKTVAQNPINHIIFWKSLMRSFRGSCLFCLKWRRLFKDVSKLDYFWHLKNRNSSHKQEKKHHPIVFIYFSAGKYLFKVNNRNTRARCEICSKFTIKIPQRRHWRRFSVFFVNFEQISHLFLVFLLLTLSR